MAFDLNGARNAGYSDTEIANFVAQQRGFDVAGARQAGYSDSDILQHFGLVRPARVQEPVPERGFLGTIGARAGDVAGSLVSGAGSVATGAGGLAGVAGGGYDNLLSRTGRGVSEFGEGLMSPELRNRRQALADAIKDAEDRGFVAEAGAALRTLAQNPGLLASMLVEQIPAFVLSGGAGRIASVAGQAAARRAGIEATEQVASRAGQAGAIGAATGVQAGGIADETYREVMGLPAETLQSSPAYRELIGSMSPEQARQTLAERAARQAGVLGGAISAGAMTALPTSAERAMFSQGVSRSAIRRALGVGTGEAVSEGVEEGGGEFAQNLAIQRNADAQRSLTQGVGGAAATGAVLGGVMGAGVGALQGAPSDRSGERPELRQAIGDIVAAREPVQEGGALPGAPPLLAAPVQPPEPIFDTPAGTLSRSQLLGFMDRRLPGLMESSPELASRMSYAANDDERLGIFREFLNQNQESLARTRQETETARIPSAEPDLFSVAPISQQRAQPQPLRPATAPTAAPQVVPESSGLFVGFGAPKAAQQTPQEGIFDVPVGRQFPVQTPDGSMNVDVRPEIIDLFSLTPASGGLQNRMIENPANQATIASIANAPDFSRLRTTPFSDRGAPIVGPDSVIEVGNHRIEGLKRAAENNPEGYARYVKALNQAGYNTEGVRYPVLIRRRVTDLDDSGLQEFTRLSNAEANQSLSDVELARQDAQRLTPELLLKFDGEVTGGIRAAKNMPFIREFISQITTPNERNRLISSEGKISDALADRLERALFASAYGDISLIKRAVDSGDDDVKSITSGMLDATGAMQELRRGIRDNRIRPEFDIVPPLVNAVDRIRSGKANGLSPSDILSTEDMLNPIPQVERELIKLLSNEGMSKIASKSAIGKRLKAYVEEAKTQTTNQDIVGGERRISPEDAISIARNHGQASMFSARNVGGQQQTQPAEQQEAPNTEKAQGIVNDYLKKLRAEGRQGRLIANGLSQLLNDRKMDANQIYQGFVVAETLAKTLPSNADYRLRFLNDIVVDNEKAGEASGAKVGSAAQGRVIYPTESLPGFIELSLNADMLPYLRETAAHEAFHVLQSYFSENDKSFAERVGRFFKNDMTIADLEPSIKRRLQNLKPPGSKESYYDSLVRGLGDSKLSAKEAQAYAFGSLLDASNRGQQVTALIPSFQRFVIFAKAFFAGTKRILTGDGFTSPADILTQAQRRGRAMTQKAPVVKGQSYSSGAFDENDPRMQYSARATNTSVPEFVNWWNGGWRGKGEKVGPSVLADASGQPIRYYHGTRASFDRFDKAKSGALSDENDRDREGPFFFSPDANFANSYATHLYADKYPDEIAPWFDYRKGFAPKIYPVYLSAQNPFDYENIEHLRTISDKINTNHPDFKHFTGGNNPEKLPSVMRRIGRGGWVTIERPMVQEAIRASGFDSFFLKEHNVKNIAVYNPRQIKSIFNQFAENEAARANFSARRVDSGYAARVSGSVAGLPPFNQRTPTLTPQMVQGAELNVQYDIVSRAIGRRFENLFQRKMAGIKPEDMTKEEAAEAAKARAKAARAKAKIESFFMKFQDSMLPVGRLIDDVRANGGNVAVAMDAYLKQDLLQGKVATMLEERNKNLYGPLTNAIADSGLSMQDFENYLYARHAKERNDYIASINPDMPDGGSGLTSAEAAKMMREFQQQGKTDKLKRLAKMFDAIIADTNKVRVDGGLNPDFSKITTTDDGRPIPKYEFYAPLRNMVDESVDGDETTREFRPSTGKALGARGREDKRALGRERKAGDILAHAMMQNTQAIIRAETNKVGQSFLELLRGNPEQSKGVAEIISNTPLKRALVNGTVKLMPDPTYKNDPNVLVVKENGREVAVRIYDENVARAMTGASTLSPTSKNILIQGMALVNRYLAKVNTAYNPEFLITNFARDLQTFGINVQQFDIDGITKDTMRDLKGSLSGIRDVLRDTNNNPAMAAYFKRFRELGGTTDMYGFADIETRIAEINEAMAKVGGNQTKNWKDTAKTAVTPVIKFLEDYNTIVENGIRTSLFKNLVERGFNEEKAAQAAKNITVNFSKGGENRVFMNAMYLFYNASLQGTMAMVNAIGRSKKVQKIVAGVVVAGVLQDVLNSMLSDVGDDEEKTYDKIPDYILKRSFVLMDPFGITEGGYFSFPMPYGFNAFFNMGREMSRVARGATDPMKAAGSIVGTFVDSFNPVGGYDNFLNLVSPTILDPVVDISFNRDFADRPIVPERGGFGPPQPESQKYWNNTFAPYIGISDFLNQVTGGTRVIPGAVDISPNIIQYIVNYATGGVGKFAERTFNTATGTIPDALRGDLEELDVRGVPLLRSLYGNVTGRSNTERFMERMNEVLQIRNEIRDASQYGQTERIQATMERYPGQIEIMDTFNQISRQRAQISQQVNQINRNPNISAEDKREIVRALRDQQNTLTTAANRLYVERVQRRE